MQFRQGDLLIKEIKEIPTTAKLVKDSVLVRGESTGHAHRLVGGQVFKDGEALFLQLATTGKIIHEEHKPLVLKAGKYAVIRQREYTMGDMTRLVTD